MIRIEAIASHPDFRPLADLGHGIAVDLRYATTDNFVGHSVYTGIDCAWLRREAATALEQAAAWLQLILEQEIGPLLADYWREQPATAAAQLRKLLG